MATQVDTTWTAAAMKGIGNAQAMTGISGEIIIKSIILSIFASDKYTE